MPQPIAPASLTTNMHADVVPTLSANIFRTLDIEEPSNRYFIHRISHALIPLFIRARVTPNTVSAMGAACGAAAAGAYFHYHSPWACVAGFVLMIGWHVFDGADGQLARMTGQVTPLGFVIDGVCDYATFIFVYLALGFQLAQIYGSTIWILVVGAGVCHAVQAAAFELQREAYNDWTKPATGGGNTADAAKAAAQSEPKSAAVRVIVKAYTTVQSFFRPISANQAGRLSMRRAPLPGAGDMLSYRYRHAFRRTVLMWSVLSANNRTLTIFAACLAGFPEAYFVYEVVVLSIAMIGLIVLNRLSAHVLLQTMEAI